MEMGPIANSSVPTESGRTRINSATPSPSCLAGIVAEIVFAMGGTYTLSLSPYAKRESSKACSPRSEPFQQAPSLTLPREWRGTSLGWGWDELAFASLPSQVVDPSLSPPPPPDAAAPPPPQQQAARPRPTTKALEEKKLKALSPQAHRQPSFLSSYHRTQWESGEGSRDRTGRQSSREDLPSRGREPLPTEAASQREPCQACFPCSALTKGTHPHPSLHTRWRGRGSHQNTSQER